MWRLHGGFARSRIGVGAPIFGYSFAATVLGVALLILLVLYTIGYL